MCSNKIGTVDLELSNYSTTGITIISSYIIMYFEDLCNMLFALKLSIKVSTYIILVDRSLKKYYFIIGS